MKKTTSSPQAQLPHDRKFFGSRFQRLFAPTVLLFALVLSSFTTSAFILDDFNSALSGWTPAANGGSAVQSAGQVTISSLGGAGYYTFIKKSDRTFTNLATHTLEFKVLVNSIGVSTNGMALLGWVPTSGTPGANGYFLAVGGGAVQVWANSGPIYSTILATNLPPSATNLPSSNLYLAMKMTPDGANMIVKSSVYAKADGRYNVLFEHTVTNSSTPMIGTSGNAFLGVLDTSGPAASSSFDDLTYYDTVRTVVDDFSGPYPGTGWTDVIPGTATNYNDGAGHLVTIDQSTGPNSGAVRTDKTYKISDGVRLELRADIADIPVPSAQDFTILAYVPNGVADITGLHSYHIAFTMAQFYVGKTFGVWWDPAYTFPSGVPQSNIRLIQTFTGEGTTVRIESRLEDLTKDVNDPARIFYQIMHVDSSATYLNFDGQLALSQYRNNPPGNQAVNWDLVEVNYPAGGNSPPIVSGQSPVDGKNFYAAAGGVAFNVSDDASAPLGNIKLILNGITYTNGSPGVTITPTNVSSLSRHFTFTNLASNLFYKGSIVASDNLGATTTAHYEFDTFLTNNLQIEAEDFNYSSNPGVDGGLFFDTGLGAYAGQQGTREIDYHDSQTKTENLGGNSYRPDDYPRTYFTADPARPQYVAAGQPEYLVYDNNNGDWRNYTRTIPAGTYKVYSRHSTFALSASLVTLELVTSDRTISNQTTTVLGSFIQLGDERGDTGYDNHRDVPLTDASGNEVVVRLAGGVTTLRVTDRYVQDDENAEVFHNYMVLVPTADPGTLRPVVSQSMPVPGSTSRSGFAATALTFASIANRDTTVTNVVGLKMNGANVAFTTTNTASGMDVGWSLAVVPAARIITNSLTYLDSDGVSITTSWSYSYPFLSATNRLAGILTTRGFDYRMVQADAYPGADNTRAKGEDQLAIPPLVPYDRTWQTNVQTLDWNDDNGTNIYGMPDYWTPGLDGGISGYPHGPYNYIAMEALGYVQLSAGAHRFEALSDDSFEVRSGKDFTVTGAQVLGYHDGSSGNPRSFDFVAEADGLYPMRIMWQEEGGGAAFHLSALNPVSGTNNVVNDPADPAGVTQVYFPAVPLALYSSATISGPYLGRVDAVISTATKTVTVPISGSTQFFRMGGATAVTIQTIKRVGSNIVITYL